MYKLNPAEIKIIEKIAKNTAINYAKKNKYLIKEFSCDVYDNIDIFDTQNDIYDFENIFENNFSANNIEKVFSDEKLYKSVEVLTFKEKLVLFSLYIEDKNINEIEKILNVSPTTIRVIKHTAIKKIIKNYINFKGE